MTLPPAYVARLRLVGAFVPQDWRWGESRGGTLHVTVTRVTPPVGWAPTERYVEHALAVLGQITGPEQTPPSEAWKRARRGEQA